MLLFARVPHAVAAAIALSQTTSALEQLQNPITGASSTFCDTLCQHVQGPANVGSIGGTIWDSISSGNGGILLGSRIPGCGYESSAIWNIWANGFEGTFPSGIERPGSFIAGTDDRVCIDKVTLGQLTAAATRCLSHVHGSGGQSAGHFDSGLGGSKEPGIPDPPKHEVPPVDTGATSGGSGIGGGLAGVGGVTGGGSSSNINAGSNSGTTSSSGWGSGNVHSDSICFKIKDKRSDRYLTTYGSEYAFAYYPNYYSVFKAHPSKTVENGYTLYEVNRNGGNMNLPVKVDGGLNSFKPANVGEDAVWTFTPANFGDSCWGVPGKKMSRRHDWSGWGDNYRIASSGEDCADVELEEAAC